MPLEILPNSTPVLAEEEKTSFNEVLRVLYSGTYGDKEGVNYLIEGVRMARTQGCPCKLILLGKAPEKLTSRYANDNSIEFKGFVSDEELISLLKSSDILAMVRTNTEFANFGFPFKLSEYLSTGNVVIATKVGDVCKYLTDKKNAYLIEPENAEAVCCAILHIKENPQEALKIAAKGLDTMKEKFSVENVGKSFISFFNRI